MIFRLLGCLVFLSSFALSQQITPAIVWPTPASVPYGTPISAVQLNAHAISSPVVPVPLAGLYNVTGITTAGFQFTEGFDEGSSAYSNTVLSGTVNWRGVVLPVGLPDQPDALSQVINIPLPAGHFANLLMLANSVNNQTPSAQNFLVNYTDGTSVFIPQSMSDWTKFEHYSGEDNVLCSPSRNHLDGTVDYTSVCLRGYRLPLDITKVPQSVTIPLIRNIVVVSMGLETVSVPGSFTYNYTPGTVLKPNTYTLTTTFTPTDTTTYGSATATIPFTVTTDIPKLPVTITWPQPQPILYGTPLSSVQLNATVAQMGYAVVQVPLFDDFNINAIETDGQPYGGHGLDGAGHSFSTQALGASVFFNGSDYALGTASEPNAVTSATVQLPAENHSDLYFLGFALSGAQTGQPFTITYSDGSTSVQTVSLSPWTGPQNLAGESIVRATTVMDEPGSGQIQSTVADIYGYHLALDKTKTLSSLTLPNNQNVMVLAIGVNDGGTYTVPGALSYNPGTGAILPDGIQPLSATFTPVDTTNYATVTVPNKIQVIDPSDLDFTLTASVSSISIPPGGVGSVILNVSPTLLNLYPGTVTFALAGGFPPNTVVSFSPSSIPFTAGPATVIMTIDMSKVASNRGDVPLGVKRSAEVVFACGLLMLPLAGMRRFRRTFSGWQTLAGLAVLFALLAGVTGCTTIYRGATYTDTIRATAGARQHSVPLQLDILLR